MNKNNLHIETSDGFVLKATEFLPDAKNGIGVIINGATGVLRVYYQAFAEFLCDNGFTVLTYDYRGIGDSREARDHAPVPTMLHWGQRDMDAVFRDFQTRHPELTIKGMGHSIGGQLLGVMPDNNRYHSFLGIASQHIHWKNWPLKDRPLVIAFFFGVLPLFYKLTGGLPNWVLGSEYLPKHVARDWSRFGRKRAWIADEKGKPLRDGFHGYEGKMRLVGMSDDKRFAPPSCVSRLAAMYKKASPEVHILEPQQLGMKSIDHFGFFQKKMNRHAWEECAEWLAGH